jgi:hypothetical protein
MILINHSSLEQTLFGILIFRRRRFKIARSAQISLIISNSQLIINN